MNENQLPGSAPVPDHIIQTFIKLKEAYAVSQSDKVFILALLDSGAAKNKWHAYRIIRALKTAIELEQVGIKLN